MIFPLAVSSLNNVHQLICYNNQLPVVQQYFTNIASIQNMCVLHQIWLHKILGGILLICQNTTMRVYGAWIKTKYITFDVQKHIAICYNHPLVCDKPLKVPAFVRLIYWPLHRMHSSLVANNKNPQKALFSDSTIRVWGLMHTLGLCLWFSLINWK